jgi:hypothetical protein
MYDGAMSRYWINDVIICHGSNCIPKPHSEQSASPSHSHRQRRKATYEDNARDNIQPERRHQRHDDIPKDMVREDRGKRKRLRLGQIAETLERKQERCNLQRVIISIPCKPQATSITDRHVNRDERKPNHRARVPPLASLRPVAERQDEAHNKQAEVEVVENHIGRVDALEVEFLILHRVGENGEGDVVIGLHRKKQGQ